MLRSPSKHLTLEFLLLLRDSDYCNKDRGVDYAPCEVDDLIYEKQEAQQLEARKREEKEQYEHALHLLKMSRRKVCTACGDPKDWKEFDRDVSKRIFTLRSHCKGCRKLRRKRK